MLQYTVIGIIILLVFLIFFVLLLIRKKPIERPSNSIEITTHKEITINDILEIVSNPSTNKNQLFNASRILIKNFSIPNKINGEIPDKAKPFFSFILLLASHPNADAKLISYVNLEMKNKNPEYSSQIDSYEEQGIFNRNKRLRKI